MALIKWKNEFSVNISAIDTQHKKLIEIINDLHAAMSAGKANDALREIFAKLAAYTKEHFAYEEQLFSKYAYASSVQHKSSHSKLISQLKELENQVLRGQMVSLKTYNFLKLWLTEHILKEDKQYVEFLSEKVR
jgi:hemerythrin-like metal-binding protein